MADEFSQVVKENCSEQARRSQVSGSCSQFQRSFIQRVTLLGKLPTSFVLHREKKQKVAAILGIDQEAMKSLPEGDLQDCLLSKVSQARLSWAHPLPLHPTDIGPEGFPCFWRL